MVTAFICQYKEVRKCIAGAPNDLATQDLINIIKYTKYTFAFTFLPDY